MEAPRRVIGAFRNEIGVDPFPDAGTMSDRERDMWLEWARSQPRPRCIGIVNGERCITRLSAYTVSADARDRVCRVLCDICHRRVVEEQFDRGNYEYSPEMNSEERRAIQRETAREQERHDLEARRQFALELKRTNDLKAYARVLAFVGPGETVSTRDLHNRTGLDRNTIRMLMKQAEHVGAAVPRHVYRKGVVRQRLWEVVRNGNSV